MQSKNRKLLSAPSCPHVEHHNTFRKSARQKEKEVLNWDFQRKRVKIEECSSKIKEELNTCAMDTNLCIFRVFKEQFDEVSLYV